MEIRSERFHKYGIYALYLTCCASIVSSSMLAVASVIMITCWLVSGSYKNLPAVIRQNPITIWSVLFCCLLLAGVLYSPASLYDSLGFFKKYRILLFIPIVMSLAKGQNKVADNIVNALLFGYLIVLVNAYLVHFGLLDPNVLSDKRKGGGFLVILAYLVFQRIFLDKKYRYLWIGFFLAICYDIFFLLITRTGWLIFICLTVLFLVQHFSLKHNLIFLALCVVLALGVFFSSESLQQRIDLTIHNLQDYNATEKNSRTSLGVRLDWYQDSIDLIKQRPLFGYGTGSYEIAQKALIEGKETQPTGDPHNEFFLTSVQIGLVGCAVLLLLFIDPLRRSLQLLSQKQKEQAFALQAVILFLLVGCFFNSWLLSSVPSHIFAFLVAAFYPFRA